jgi:plastocyanin domain-containing protein
VPVKWVIDGQEVTECNRRLVVPALGLSVDIRPGENLVEFTPETVGIIPWSCWMGMLQGRFVVEGSNPIPNVAE